MRFLILCGLVGGILLVAATSRSDSPEPADVLPMDGASEPAKGPLGTELVRDPLSPYDSGPPETHWRYEDMSLAEKDVIDRGRDVSSWTGVNAALERALEAQAQQSTASMAQARLGIENLETLGVVP